MTARQAGALLRFLVLAVIIILLLVALLREVHDVTTALVIGLLVGAAVGAVEDLLLFWLRRN